MSAEHGHCLWDALRLAELGSLPARSAKALKRFRDLIQSLREGMKETPLPVLLERLLDQTGYLALYDKDDPELRAKLENLEELVTAAQEFTEETDWNDEEDLLVAFLDHIALVSDIDGWRHEQGISLMTLHSAKGLEFEAVCVAGLEDGLLPHFNSGGTQDEIEEERRLLYVGMTRAKQRLFLTGCRRRRIAGRYQDQQESPFLLEIPEKNLVITESPELFYNGRTRGAYDFFGRRGAVEIEPEVVTGGTLRRGRRVRHPTLGEGVLMQLEGEGDNAKLTVFFDRSGKRKLVAKYANLELL
jgi:DNA helicase-2/ATP-dependent DNA helicase PcrA